ncbi:hypothetical protein HDU92_007635 [Lobulomyces angularis]|nr:hypothetical protein HDU92_007635 [Lobulomyces angularis]
MENRQENGEKIEQKTENNSKNIVFEADTSRLITSIEDVPKRSSVLILPTILENQELQKALDDNTTASQGTSKNKSSNNQKGKKIVDEYDKEINSLFNDIFEDRSKGSSSSAALPPDK